MEFQLFLPQMRMTFAQLVERARAAETAGFVGIPAWITSRHPWPRTSRCTRR